MSTTTDERTEALDRLRELTPVGTKVYTVIDDALAGPIDALAGTQRSWLDDPFGLEPTEVTS